MKHKLIDIEYKLRHSGAMGFLKITRNKIILTIITYFLVYEVFWFIYRFFFCIQLNSLGLPRFGDEPVSTSYSSFSCITPPYFVILETVTIVVISYLFSCIFIALFTKQKIKKTSA